MDQIKDFSKEKLIYIDESGIDMSISKERSCSLKGKPEQAKKSGKYYEHTNIIAGLSNSLYIST